MSLHIHAYTHTHPHSGHCPVFTSLHLHMFAHTFICLTTSAPIRIQHMQLHARMHAFTHTARQTCTVTHTCIHRHAFICTSVCASIHTIVFARTVSQVRMPPDAHPSIHACIHTAVRAGAQSMQPYIPICEPAHCLVRAPYTSMRAHTDPHIDSLIHACRQPRMHTHHHPTTQHNTLQCKPTTQPAIQDTKTHCLPR